jgi:hypothetical protein
MRLELDGDFNGLDAHFPALVYSGQDDAYRYDFRNSN